MSYHAVRHVRSFIKRSMGLAGRGNSGKDVEEHTMRVARALRSSMTDVEHTAALVVKLLAWLTGAVVEGVFTDAALDVARCRENRLAISKVPSEKGKCDYCHSWRQGSHKRIEHLLADSRKFFSSIADDFLRTSSKAVRTTPLSMTSTIRKTPTTFAHGCSSFQTCHTPKNFVTRLQPSSC